MIRVYDQTLTQQGVITGCTCRFKRELRGAGSFEIRIPEASDQGLLQTGRIVALDAVTNGIIVSVETKQDDKGRWILAKGTSLLAILAYRVRRATT